MSKQRRSLLQRFSMRKTEAKDSWQSRLLRLSRFVQYWDDRTKVGRVRHLRRAIERYSALGISNLAATLSYYIIFALFPFAIFVSWFIARFGGSLITPYMLSNFRNFVPEQVRDILAGLLDSVSSSATVAMASLGVLALLWSSSRAFAVLAYTMDLVYSNHRNTATYFIQQIFSLLITLIASVAIMIMLLSMAFGSYIIGILEGLFTIKLFEGSGATYLNYAISLLLLSVIFSLIYQVTSKRKREFRYAFACGLACAISWVVVTFLVSLYLQQSARYSLLYGSVTSIIILMFWLYLCSTSLLIFAFIHSEILLIQEREIIRMKPLNIQKKLENRKGLGPVGVNTSALHHRNARFQRRKR